MRASRAPEIVQIERRAREHHPCLWTTVPHERYSENLSTETLFMYLIDLAHRGRASLLHQLRI